MVDLPQLPGGIPTVQAPQSSVSPNDVRGEANAWADNLQSAGNAIEEAAMPWAKAEAMQSVTRTFDPVTNQSSVHADQALPIFGRLGDVFAQTQQATYHAQVTSSMETDLGRMRAEYNTTYHGDPNALKAAMDAYVQQRVNDQPGIFNTIARNVGDQMVGQYFNSALSEKIRYDGEMAKQTLQSQIQTLDDKNVAFARQNYGGPEFEQGFRTLSSYWHTLAADPRMGVSPAMAQAKIDEAGSRYKANSYVGEVERAADPKSGGSWDKAATIAEKILTDPSLRLDEHERRTYYNMAIGAVKLMDSDRRAQASAIGLEGNQVVANIHAGVPIDADYVDDFVKRASDVGATKVVDMITKARTVQTLGQTFKGMSLPQLAALGEPNGTLPAQTFPIAGLEGDQADPNAARALAMREVQRQGLVGVVPPDGAKYGIKTGSAEEWGNYFIGLAKHESGLNNKNVGDVGSFGTGSRGLYQLSQGDPAAYGLNGGKPFTIEQLEDPYTNTAAAVSITKQLLDKNGTIQAGPGKYWGPINNEGWTPGKGRDADLPWQDWNGSPQTGQMGPEGGPATGWTVNPPAGIARAEAVRTAAANEKSRLDAVMSGQAPVTSDAFATAALGKAMKETIGTNLPNMIRATNAFEMPAQADVDALGKMASMVGTPEQQRQIAELGVRAEFGAAAQAMPEAQLEALVSAKLQDYRTSGTQAQRDASEWVRKLPDEIRSRFDKDPWSAAAWIGIDTPSTRQPLDFSGPDSLAAGLNAREADALRLQASKGIPAPSAMLPAEIPLAKQIIAQGTPDHVAQLFGAINSIKSEDVRRATLQSLGAGADIDPQLLAGSLVGKNTSVATSVLNGLLRLKDPTFRDKDNNFDGVFTPLFPPKDFSVDAKGDTAPRTWQMVRSAAMARIADMNFQKGQQGLSTTDGDVTQALNDVTGGVVSWNGRNVIVPRYGMGDTSFGTVMKSLSPDDLRGAVTADGKPMTAADLTSWNSPYKLQSVGDGLYSVFTEAGTVRRYVQQGGSLHLAHEGGPFLLDLKGAANRVLSGG